MRLKHVMLPIITLTISTTFIGCVGKVRYPAYYAPSSAYGARPPDCGASARVGCDTRIQITRLPTPRAARVPHVAGTDWFL